MSDEIADVIAGTREYIEKNGWWRGSMYGPNGRQACVYGGMARVLGLKGQVSVNLDPRAQLATDAILRVIKPLGFRAVPDWNDDQFDGAKNKQDVLDVLAKAEKWERAGFDPDAP